MNTPNKKTLAKFQVLENLFKASLALSGWFIENPGIELFRGSLGVSNIDLKLKIRDIYSDILSDLDISPESWCDALNKSTKHIYCIRIYDGVKMIARDFKGQFCSMVNEDMFKALKEVFTP